MNNKQLLLLFGCFFLSLLSVYAQESEAAKAFRAKNDSLVKAWQKEFEEEALLRRNAFLVRIDTIASDSLTVLNARSMELKTLPDLSRFKRLKQIQLEGHSLVQLPKSTFKADSLTHIVVGHSKLEKVQFPTNRSVKVLSLHHNQLKRVPYSVRKLKNLRSLNLEHNKIERIPRFIKRMDSLKDINLNFNQLQLNKRSIKRLARIEAISLGGNKLKVLPENTGNLHKTKSLNLGKNSISSLPESFKKLENLEHIIFYENKFKVFPEAVLSLKRLKHIDFYRNQLTSLPDALDKLTHLEQLFISFNQLEALPESLQNLDSLTYLYAHNNKLIIFPEWIPNHKKLQRIGLSNNRIIQLPDLTLMPALTDLDVQNNLIDRFPWELLEKESIHLLILKDNAFNLDSKEREKLKIITEGLKENRTVVVF
jgi:Leucine-rich repeat (LRR) protein